MTASGCGEAGDIVVFPSNNAPLPLPREQWDALRMAYASPARAYHHFGHVEDMLGHYAEVADGPGWSRPVEVWLAVLYHDAVYVPGRNGNESASAALAAEHLHRWWPESAIDARRVAELILLTARHGALRSRDFPVDDPSATDTRHFLDCDMAILAAAFEKFSAYDRAIAEEYRGRAPQWLFRMRRKRFFQRLLESERIFLSEYFHDRYETRARDNIRALLASAQTRRGRSW